MRLTQNDQIRQDSKCGEGCISRGQLRPFTYRKGAGPKRSPVLSFPFIYAYTICRWTTKFHAVAHVGARYVSWGQPRLPSQHSGVPNFGGSPVFMAHPLTQNDQIRHGNAYWEGLYQLWRCNTWVFRGQSRPLPRGGVLALPNLGSFLFMHAAFVTELPNSRW